MKDSEIMHPCRLLPQSMHSKYCSSHQAFGATLVTGGLGSLGLLVSFWLAQANTPARFKLILLGRSGRADDPLALEKLLRECQSCVQIHRCDISSLDEVASVYEACHKVSFAAIV